jgi:hypothetical protein
MPKPITHSPDPCDVPAAHAPSGALLVPLTWAQAQRIRDRGRHVYYDCEERTGRYRYSADIRDVLADPTPAMRARAGAAGGPMTGTRPSGFPPPSPRTMATAG